MLWSAGLELQSVVVPSQIVAVFADCWPVQLDTASLYAVIRVVRATIGCGSGLTAMGQNGASLPVLSVAYHYMLGRGGVCLPYLVLAISHRRVGAIEMTWIRVWRRSDNSSTVREIYTAASRWPGRVKGSNGAGRVRRACLIRSLASFLRVHAIRPSQRLVSEPFGDRLGPSVCLKRYADISWEGTCHANSTSIPHL